MRSSRSQILDELDVDGMLISPGYHYESVDRDIFLTQSDIHQKFKRLMLLKEFYKLIATPVYMEFGRRSGGVSLRPLLYRDSTRARLKGPCYLIGEKVLPDLGRSLDRRGLGLLGAARGPALRQLQDAQRLRGERGEGRHQQSQATW